MTCPYLDYRRDGDGRTFEASRAYCTVTDQFVQPMRTDICNDRYDLDHAEHCEIYLAHEADAGVAQEADDGDGER